MFGGLMIGDFRYSAHPRADDVVVEMYWQDGERMAVVVVSDPVLDEIRVQQLPSLSPLPVIAAVAYAMVLAEKSSRQLRLSGDTSVWRSSWGALVMAH